MAAEGGDGAPRLLTIVVFAFGTWGDATCAVELAVHAEAHRVHVLASVAPPLDAALPAGATWHVVDAVPPTAAEELPPASRAGATGLDAVLAAATAAVHGSPPVDVAVANCWSVACASVAERLWPHARWLVLSPAPPPAALSVDAAAWAAADEAVANALARDDDLAAFCAFFDGVVPTAVHAFAPLFGEHHAAWRARVGLRPHPLLPLPLPRVLYTVDECLVAPAARARWPPGAACIGWRPVSARPSTAAPMCPALAGWLARCERDGAATPTVLVTLGSMARATGGSTATPDLSGWATEISRVTGARVIVHGATSVPGEQPCGCTGGEAASAWRVPHWVDHGAVMQHCAVVVHHAGAGTAHAVAATTARSVAVPLAFDQPAWAKALAVAGRGCVVPAAHDAATPSPAAVAAAVAAQLALPPLHAPLINPTDWASAAWEAIAAAHAATT
jgi:hypothetical protein